MPIPLMQHGGGSDLELDPSELTCQIRWESPIVDEAGTQTGDYNDEGDDWAKIEPFAGRELFLAGQVSPRITHRITTYWREGVKPDWRIIFEERVFEFDRVIDKLEQKTVLEIIAIEDPQPKI